MSDSNTPLIDQPDSPRLRDELRAVIGLSVPIVVATCSRMVMDVSDFWMISRTGDTDALAAILPAQMIMWSYIVIGLGTVSIVNTMASQALGRGQTRTCSVYAWQTLYLAGVLWLIGAMLWPLLPRIFTWTGHGVAIQAMESRYASICVWTIGPSIAAAGLSNFFNGIHRPGVTMKVAIEGVAINGAVSYVLIFGEFGLPAMGIAGAAWGTVVGTSYRVLRLTHALCAPVIHAEFDSRNTWRFSRAKMVNIFRFGGPSGLQWWSDVTVWAIFTTVLVGSYFGKIEQLATNAAWQYLRISFMPAVGVGVAVSSMVGRAIGAGKPQLAVRVTRVSAGLLLAYMGSLSIIYFIWRRELIGFFSDDPKIVTIGAAVMVCAAIFQVFDAIGIAYNSALRGAGDTFMPSLVFIVSHWVVVIGGGFFVVEMYPEMGSIGPWTAATVLIILTGVYQWWRWRSGVWRKIDVFKHDRPENVDIANASASIERAVEV